MDMRKVWYMRKEEILVARRGTYVLYNGNWGWWGLLIGTRNIIPEAGAVLSGKVGGGSLLHTAKSYSETEYRFCRVLGYCGRMVIQ